jgi:hypothetical protein
MYTSITHFPSVNTPQGATNGPVYPPTLATDGNGVVQLVYTQQFYASFGVATYQIVKTTVGGGSTVTLWCLRECLSHPGWARFSAE